MNPHDQKWPRLAAAARHATDLRDTAAPPGFATRVAARAFLQERPPDSLFARFSFRALGLAGLLAVVCLAANYSALTGAFGDDSANPDDPVAELLDLDFGT